MSQGKREHWGSRWGFLLATAGAAIGLGNIWKFPYITGMNGGGAFVLIYLICILLVGLPIMTAELTLGRAAGTNAVAAFKKMSLKKTMLSDLIGLIFIWTGLNLVVFGSWGYAVLFFLGGLWVLLQGWTAFGIGCGVLVPFLICCYYSVIGGWTLIYVIESFGNMLSFTTPAGADAVMKPIVSASGNYFYWAIAAHVGFIMICGLMIVSGVQKGIERWSKVLMPILFGLLLVLILRGISLPGAMKGIGFFLFPDFSKLSVNSAIVAMGQAFFTLSLAMGITFTYGSYLDRNVNIIKSSLIVIVLDTLAAMMAGLAIFPAVFAMGFKENAGPELIYKILPAAFNSIPGGFGYIWNSLFFLMILIAALTSGISLLEPLISICVDELKMRRKTAVITIVGLIALGGSFVAVSMSNWDRFPALGAFIQKVWGTRAPAHLFDLLDSFACNWMLPLGGLALTIFVGWVWGSSYALDELRHGAGGRLDSHLLSLLAGIDRQQKGQNFVFTPALVWGLLVRWLAPVLVLIAFLNGVGVISFNSLN